MTVSNDGISRRVKVFAVIVAILTLTPLAISLTARVSPISLATTTSTTILSGLVGYWSFDENNGNHTVDSSGNGNNGTLINSPTWLVKTCKFVNCLGFDGSTNYVRIAYSPSIDPAMMSSFTYSSWVYTNSRATQTILETGGGCNVQTVLWLAGGVPTLSVFHSAAGTSIRASSPLSIHKWHSIIVTWSGTQLIMYVDGAQISHVPFAAAIDSGAHNSSWLEIAKYHDCHNYLNGNIDDLRIYNRALSASEIQQLYNLIK